jgi:hypothetical protein
LSTPADSNGGGTCYYDDAVTLATKMRLRSEITRSTMVNSRFTRCILF